MFQGLRTLIYQVNRNDLDRAKAWYTKLLGTKPYFDEPFYVGFEVGGFEFGIDPVDREVVLGDNMYTYMGVPDIEKAFKHCLSLDAKPHIEIKEVGEGIKVATVRDPFGNLFGLIENPHFKAQ